MKRMKKKGVSLLFAALVAVAMIGAAHAQNKSTQMSQAEAKSLARAAMESASLLADLVDVAREDFGAPTLDQALKRAREVAPKTLPGMGQWWADPSGRIGARVDEPVLCREMMTWCLEPTPGRSGRCTCTPSSNGSFEFMFKIEPLGLRGFSP